MNEATSSAVRVRSVREQLGLSQEGMARELKVNRSYISLIEQGEREPSEKVLDLLRVCEFKATEVSGQFAVGLPPALPRYVSVLTWLETASLLSSDYLPAGAGDKLLTDNPDPHAFAVIIGSDCMEPEHRIGARALVMPCRRPRNGCLVIANMVVGGPVFRAWTMNDAQGVTFRLTARHEGYRPIDSTPDDVHWVYPVASIHKTVW